MHKQMRCIVEIKVGVRCWGCCWEMGVSSKWGWGVSNVNVNSVPNHNISYHISNPTTIPESKQKDLNRSLYTKIKVGKCQMSINVLIMLGNLLRVKSGEVSSKWKIGCSKQNWVIRTCYRVRTSEGVLQEWRVLKGKVRLRWVKVT